MQRYGNQNPVSIILLCNSKWFNQTKQGEVLLLLAYFCTIVCPHAYPFNYSENSQLCGPQGAVINV